MEPNLFRPNKYPFYLVTDFELVTYRCCIY